MRMASLRHLLKSGVQSGGNCKRIGGALSPLRHLQSAAIGENPDAKADQVSDRIEDSPSLRARRLEGKVALITGGASGIGEATARLFALHGAKVVIADIQEQLGEQVAAEIGSAKFVRCDVTEERQIEAAVEAAVSTYGGLDVLLNIAGVSGSFHSIHTLDAEVFDRVWASNARGSVLGVKHAARAMIPARRGSIICMASVAALMAMPGNMSYAVSKAAVTGLVKFAAGDLDRFGIRVNGIAPMTLASPLLLNYMRAQVNPELSMKELEAKLAECWDYKGPPLTASDVAEAALFLASDESAYISGHTIVLDGGYTIKKGWSFKKIFAQQ